MCLGTKNYVLLYCFTEIDLSQYRHILIPNLLMRERILKFKRGLREFISPQYFYN